MSLKGRGGEEGEEGILTERSGHWYYLKDRFKQRGVCKKTGSILMEFPFMA